MVVLGTQLALPFLVSALVPRIMISEKNIIAKHPSTLTGEAMVVGSDAGGSLRPSLSPYEIRSQSPPRAASEVSSVPYPLASRHCSGDLALAADALVPERGRSSSNRGTPK